ncbi:MAG: HlyC/CorC family transporter [Sedimentisphaerales bacterium]|nr:HlyC/CorC family transporter [Sedimentisphaerales bacterium]
MDETFKKDIIVLIAAFSFALLISFLCSLLESVILSMNYSYIAALERKHNRWGKLLKKLKDRIDRPLAAILTLNTVSHTVGAAVVGAMAVKIWGNKVMAMTSALLTLLILVFSEIIPKTIGAVHWKRLAVPSAYCIWGIIYFPLIYPLVIALEVLSRKLAPKGKRIKFSREEMLATVQIGHSEGELQSQESRVIQNMLRLRNIRVKDVLTPRSVLLGFQKDQTIAQAVKEHSPIRFSRIPVYDKNLDDITGFVVRYKLMQAISDGQGEQKIELITSRIHAIPDTKSVASTLDEFIKQQEQIFLVVDEYGGTAGIITLEDAIETLLGVEIVDEFDTVEDMRKWALQQWEKRKQQQQF